MVETCSEIKVKSKTKESAQFIGRYLCYIFTYIVFMDVMHHQAI